MNNWKLIIHLLFRTKYFGVNNEWHSSFPSIFGWPWQKIIWGILTIRPIYTNYQMMKFRASPGVGFVSKNTYNKLFSKDRKKWKHSGRRLYR